jgi:L-ascorbate metabolism protein UlaG (beta-lactamase superfamily)
LSTVRDEGRTFFMTTPRIATDADVLIPMQFADRRLDLLAGMRTEPAPLTDIVQGLGIRPARRRAFEALFTTTPPPRGEIRWSGDKVRLRYFGHACVLVETASTTILLDPMFATEVADTDKRLTFYDLPDHIDYVVLSHNHQDHCVPEMLIQLRSRVGRIVVPGNNRGSIADPSMTLMLRHLGFDRIDTLSAFDTIPFADGRITSLPFPGEHADLDVHSRQGILVEAKGRRFAFLVDSDGWDSRLYRRICARIGRELDALFIGMECHGAPLTWLYGPLLTKPTSRKNDESRRLSGLNCERAWNVIGEFAARSIFVYAMGQEPWLRYLMGLNYEPDSIQLREVSALLERCRRAGINAENLYISREWLL